MSIRTIDFTKPGKMPGSQNRLGDLQTAYTNLVNGLASAGGNTAGPMCVSSMVVTTAGSNVTVTDGWFYYNGSLIPFTGSTVTLGAGEVAIVLITNAVTTLTYDDGSTPGVLTDTSASLTHAATATDATHFPVTALVPFGVGLSANNREAWTNVNLSALPIGTGGSANISIDMNFKRNFLTNSVIVQGQISITNAGSCYQLDSNTFDSPYHLPAGYTPGSDVPFIINPSLIEWVVSGGNAYVAVLAGYVDSSIGNLKMQLPKPSGSIGAYTGYFSFEYALD